MVVQSNGAGSAYVFECSIKNFFLNSSIKNHELNKQRNFETPLEILPAEEMLRRPRSTGGRDIINSVIFLETLPIDILWNFFALELQFIGFHKQFVAANV